MRIYSQQEIEDLITCEKKIINPPRKNPQEIRGHLQNNMSLESVDGKHKFEVFMRQSSAFPENFSVGLRYIPKDGTTPFTLLRCNGPHGPYCGQWPEDHPHYDYHIHKAKEENLKKGLKPEKYGEKTQDFATFQDAIKFFVEYTNIKDAEKYFNFFSQMSIFDLGDI